MSNSLNYMETKNTKIICTISDIKCEVDFIRELYKNGMNVARINSAHATVEGAQRIVDNIRAVSDRIAILVDTKGPEVRLNAMEGSAGFVVKEGDIVEIFGPDLPVTTVAEWLETIPYEVLTSVSVRIKRVYYSD